MTGWTLRARKVFSMSGRNLVVVWGELKGGEARAGDAVVVANGDRRVEGRIEGVELHRLRAVPESWVGLQVGGPAAGIVSEGSEVRHVAATTS